MTEEKYNSKKYNSAAIPAFTPAITPAASAGATVAAAALAKWC